MLRLVFRSGVFGPMYFEYPRPCIRVGSSQDNDLVLPHPSVHPYHCQLWMEEDGLAVLSPDAPAADPGPRAPRYGEGQALMIGELRLEIERSPNSIVVPVDTPVVPANPAQDERGYWFAEHPEVPLTARWLCTPCERRFDDGQVKVIGLVGARKHVLCPICSQRLIWAQITPPAPKGTVAWLRKCGRWAWWLVLKLLGFKPRRPR